MQLSTREAEKIFSKLKVEGVKSRHHVRGFVTFNGVRILPVHCSNGHKDMPGQVPKRFAKSLKLSLEQFAELKRCKMSRDEYVQILQKKGLIDAAPAEVESG